MPIFGTTPIAFTSPCSSTRRAPERRATKTLATILGYAVAASVAAGSLLGTPKPATASDGETVSLQIERAVDGSGPRAASQPVALRFDAFGRHFDLSLQRNESLVAPGVEAQIVGDQGTTRQQLAATWVGQGQDGSEARLFARGDEVRGYVKTSSGTFLLEPTASSARTVTHTVRRAEDAVGDSGISCGSDDHAPAVSLAPRSTARAAGLRTLGVSLVIDSHFYQRHGLVSVEDTLALFNQVDGIYRSELGLGLQIVQLVVYQTAAADPFSSTSSATTLLAELSARRLADPNLDLSAGGITHLLTDRDLSGINGIAWIAGVCDSNLGAGLSSVGPRPGFFDALLVAHEIGHNLGALHDGPSTSACPTTPMGFIMWPWLQEGLTDQFSTCSKDRIAQQASFASCLGEAAPSSCGDGIVDAGENCDSGSALGDVCCRSNCTFASAGLTCGQGSNVCTDAVCDGAGECVEIANDNVCMGDDACMTGRCSAGECVTAESPRSFRETQVRMKLDAQGMVVSAKFSATLDMLASGSDPRDGGVELLGSLDGLSAWSQFIPSGQWVIKGAGKFSYKASMAAPGEIRSAKIQFNPTRGSATFHFELMHPMGAMLPTRPRIQVLAGNRSDGQCAEVGPMTGCIRKGGTYSCE